VSFQSGQIKRAKIRWHCDGFCGTRCICGRLQFEELHLGGGLLRGQTEGRDESRLCVAVPGAAVAEDPVEDVATQTPYDQNITPANQTAARFWVLQLNSKPLN